MFGHLGSQPVSVTKCPCVCALTVLVLGILFCIRRYRPSRYQDGIIFPDDDVRENIIHYDEEGVGKNLNSTTITTTTTVFCLLRA